MYKDIICNFTPDKDFFLIVENCDRRCGYHKLGDCYDINHIAPSGLCPEAFHSIYPECLALLYKGDFNGLDSLKVSCPGLDGIVFEIKRIKRRSLIRRFEQILRKTMTIIRPVEILDYDIRISPIEINRHCNKGMKVNTEYYLNLHNDNGFCPAAFDSSFPWLFPLPFISENDIKIKRLCCTICPDHKTNIVFQLFHGDKRINSEEPGDGAEFPGCLSFQDIQIKTEIDSFLLKKCLPQGLCYSLFHNAYPYYLTLLHQGFFGWMKDHSCVIAQCPNPEVRIAAEIRKTQIGEVKLTVISQKRQCPKKISVGDTFLLKQENYALPFRLLRDISPYVNAVNLGISDMIKCSSSINNGKSPINIIISAK